MNKTEIAKVTQQEMDLLNRYIVEGAEEIRNLVNEQAGASDTIPPIFNAENTLKNNIEILMTDYLKTIFAVLFYKEEYHTTNDFYDGLLSAVHKATVFIPEFLEAKGLTQEFKDFSAQKMTEKCEV